MGSPIDFKLWWHSQTSQAALRSSETAAASASTNAACPCAACFNGISHASTSSAQTRKTARNLQSIRAEASSAPQFYSNTSQRADGFAEKKSARKPRRRSLDSDMVPLYGYEGWAKSMSSSSSSTSLDAYLA